MPVLDQLMSLGVMLGCAVAGGLLAGRLRLPPLVGMLVVGIGLANLAPSVVGGLSGGWSTGLRLIALTVILLRAGLGLDLGVLARLRGAFLRLSFLPNLAETATVAATSHWLFDLPWTWAMLLGFVVAAVSPAVVVPGILDLQERGFGVRKGIPTMVLAAASFDDVLSITGFGLAMSLIFADGGNTTGGEVLLRAPLELGLGLGVGVASGLFCGAIRGGTSRMRVVLLCALGLASVYGGWVFGFTGGGSLAAVTLGAVAAHRWGSAVEPVASVLGRIWTLAQPTLFVLVGASIMLSAVELSSIAAGLVILACGLLIRFAVSYGSVGAAGFGGGERVFVALAWLPKATVQAAVGGLALDLAREQQAGAQAELLGTQVLTVAVLAIVVTAPIGAIAIARAGPQLLAEHGD